MLRVERIRPVSQDATIYRFSINIGNPSQQHRILCCDVTISAYAERNMLPHQLIEHLKRDGVERLGDKIRTELALEFTHNASRGIIDNTSEDIRYRQDSGATRQQMATNQQRSRALDRLSGLTQHQQALQQSSVPGIFGGVFGGMDLSKPPDDPTLAEKKAMKLLKSNIGEKKYKQLTKTGYFNHKGKYGTYELHLNDPSGVRLVQKHKIGGTIRILRWTLCIQSQVSDMPKGDVILSRYLELIADENTFIKTANFRAVNTNDEANQPVGRQLGILTGMISA